MYYVAHPFPRCPTHNLFSLCMGRAVARSGAREPTPLAQFLGGRKNKKFAFYAKNCNGRCCLSYSRKLQRPLHQLKQ